MRASLILVMPCRAQVAMVDMSHVAAQGFAFLFFATAEAAMRCLSHPEQALRGRIVTVCHKSQVKGLAVELAAAEVRVFEASRVRTRAT